MQKYAIVEFIEENSVEIILSSWICPNNKTALWPKNITPSSLKRYLKNCTAPSDDWNSVDIRILGHSDSLAHATKKASKAQDTSHLSSSDSDLESNCTSKRQKKLPHRFVRQDTSTSSDDENLASEREKEKHINSEKRTKRPVVPSFPDVQDDCEITEINQHKKKLQEDSEVTNSSTMCNNNEKIQSKEVNTKLQKDSQVTNSSTMCKDNEKIQKSEEVNTQKSTNIIQQKKEGVLAQIFKLLEEIKIEIIESKKEQHEVKVKLDSLLTQNDKSSINKFSHLLPISSMESFNEIDDCLANSEEDFTSLIKYLKLASGETVKELVPSVMKLLLKKAVSIHFSGCGKQKKRDFSATKVAAAVFEIVSNKIPDTSKSEILKKISKFLAESGDREGGRKKRAQEEEKRAQNQD